MKVSLSQHGSTLLEVGAGIVNKSLLYEDPTENENEYIYTYHRLQNEIINLEKEREESNETYCCSLGSIMLKLFLYIMKTICV